MIRKTKRDSDQLLVTMEQFFKDQCGPNAAVNLNRTKKRVLLGRILPSLTRRFHYAHFVEVALNSSGSTATFSFQSAICYPDFTCIQAKSATLVTCVKRYTLFINSALKYGSFCCSPNGLLSFRSTASINIPLYQLKADLENKLSKLLKYNEQAAVDVLNFNINKILYIMNIQTLSEYETNIPTIKSRTLQPKHLSLLKTVLEKLLRNNSTENDASHLVLPGNGKPADSLVRKVSEKAIQNANTEIVIYGQGKFNKQILYLENGKRRAVLRRPVRNEAETKILEYLINEGSMLITVAKHYLINGSPDVMIDMYSHGTLDQFLLEVPDASILTKLWIFIYIADGIKSLNELGLIHTDIEPATIFIENNFFPRIGCLERCYVSEAARGKVFTNWNNKKYKDYKENFEMPTKIPYTPPELLNYRSENHKGEPNVKTPVYMFGMLIINILFEMKPLPYKKESFATLLPKFKHGTAKFIFSDKEAELYGPADLFQCLRLLAFRCVNPEPSMRPTIEDCIINLRKLIRFTEQLYAY